MYLFETGQVLPKHESIKPQASLDELDIFCCYVAHEASMKLCEQGVTLISVVIALNKPQCNP